MLKFLKHIKNLLLLRQVAKTYKEETGKDKPVYLSRRFLGVLFTAAAAITLAYSDIKIDAELVKQLTESTPKLIESVVAIYGVVMTIIGIVKREKK